MLLFDLPEQCGAPDECLVRRINDDIGVTVFVKQKAKRDGHAVVLKTQVGEVKRDRNDCND